MPTKNRIFDIDRHVMEPIDMWKQYLPQQFHKDAPEMISLDDPNESMGERLKRLGDCALMPTPPAIGIRNRPIWRQMPTRSYMHTGAQAAERIDELRMAETGEGQLNTMDTCGIEVATLLPTYGGYLVYDETLEPELSRAYASGYNRWIADMSKSERARLIPAAMISKHEPDKMVRDLEEALAMGHKAVVLRPNPVLNRHVGHAEFLPFWSACAEANIPVLFHEGAHTRAMTAGADRFLSHVGQHACSHPMEMMMAFLGLLEGGVLEALPRLRVGFLESGAGYMPYWLWRLDHIEYNDMRHEWGDKITQLPSEYFKRQCWIAFEPGETALDRTARELGPDRLVFGTDFPHVDHDFDITDGVFESEGADSGSDFAAHLQSALWDNAWALMGEGAAR